MSLGLPSRAGVGFALAALVAGGLFLLLRDAGRDDGRTIEYRMPSPAMEPTIAVGEVVTVDLDAYEEAEPQIGEMVTFTPPEGTADVGPECTVEHSPRSMCPKPGAAPADEVWLQRIVALPGDSVALDRGTPVVNGERAAEDFTAPCPRGTGSCDFPEPITVPEDHYFMLGDDRGASDDSRFWGPVPSAWIQGRVAEVRAIAALAPAQASGGANSRRQGARLGPPTEREAWTQGSRPLPCRRAPRQSRAASIAWRSSATLALSDLSVVPPRSRS
jgi:signal peptidase I